MILNLGSINILHDTETKIITTKIMTVYESKYDELEGQGLSLHSALTDLLEQVESVPDR